MDQSEIRMNQTSGEDRELKGLEDRGLLTLKCTNCEKELLCLQLMSIHGQDATSVLTRVVVECGMCGGYSEVQQVSGKFSPGAPSDDISFDVSEYQDGGPVADVFFKASSK